jgi:hypothetical protein
MTFLSKESVWGAYALVLRLGSKRKTLPVIDRMGFRFILKN